MDLINSGSLARYRLVIGLTHEKRPQQIEHLQNLCRKMNAKEITGDVFFIALGTVRNDIINTSGSGGSSLLKNLPELPMDDLCTHIHFTNKSGLDTQAAAALMSTPCPTESLSEYRAWHASAPDTTAFLRKIKKEGHKNPQTQTTAPASAAAYAAARA
jgi:hypothetical protein